MALSFYFVGMVLFQGTSIEPEYCIHILPLVFVNGISCIDTGCRM